MMRMFTAWHTNGCADDDPADDEPVGDDDDDRAIRTHRGHAGHAVTALAKHRADIDEIARLGERLRDAEDGARAARHDAEKEVAKERSVASAQHAEAMARMAVEHAAMLARASELSEWTTRASAAADAREARVIAELRREVAHIGAASHSAEVQRLRGEVDRLKGANHVKGAQGEAAVLAALRSAFDDWAFTDTSSRGCESDIRATSPRGEVLVVEVKNKATVTAADVAKSMRDVADLQERVGDALIAYMFVSVRSPSIPGKGALGIELTPRGVPILWLGIDPMDCGDDASGAADGHGGLLDDSRARDVVRAARLLVDVGRACAASVQRHAAGMSASDLSPVNDDRGDPNDDDDDVDHGETARALREACQAARADAAASARARAEAIARLNDQLARVDGMRRIANRLSDSVTATRRHAASLQTAVDACFRDLDAACIASDLARVACSEQQPSQQPSQQHEQSSSKCDICGKTYATPGGLATHRRVHSPPLSL